MLSQASTVLDRCFQLVWFMALVEILVFLFTESSQKSIIISLFSPFPLSVVTHLKQTTPRFVKLLTVAQCLSSSTFFLLMTTTWFFRVFGRLQILLATTIHAIILFPLESFPRWKHVSSNYSSILVLPHISFPRLVLSCLYRLMTTSSTLPMN